MSVTSRKRFNAHVKFHMLFFVMTEYPSGMKNTKNVRVFLKSQSSVGTSFYESEKLESSFLIRMSNIHYTKANM